MRKIKLFLTAFATISLALVSCQKEETESTTFAARVENGSTKMYLGNDGYFAWESTDKVRIFSTSTDALFDVQPNSSNSTSATLTGPEIGSGDYTAIFPASIAGATTNSVVLPSRQYSNDGSPRDFPMRATSSNHDLTFYNLCAAICIRIPAIDRAISKIEVRADQPIYGVCPIGITSDGKPYATHPNASNGGNMVSLQIMQPQTYTDTHDYYIAIPAGEYTKFTFYIYDEDGLFCSKSLMNTEGSNQTIHLVRSQYSRVTFSTTDLNFQGVARLRTYTFVDDNTVTKIQFHYNSNETSDTQIQDAGSVPIYLIRDGSEYHIHTSASVIQANADCQSMFRNCSRLTDIVFDEGFRTDNVTNMFQMFDHCSSLTHLDLSVFNTENVTNMKSMFNCCNNLQSLDLSSFNTAKVTNMNGMFKECDSLTQINITSFNTEKVTDMQGMFYSNKSLVSLDLSSFNTPLVTNMYQMFFLCNHLVDLNISHFNTQNVTTMQQMFDNCNALTSINVSSFNTDNVTTMFKMFNDCRSLTSLNLSSFTSRSNLNMKNMFAGCTHISSLRFSHQFEVPNDANLSGWAINNLGSAVDSRTIYCNSNSKTALENHGNPGNNNTITYVTSY